VISQPLEELNRWQQTVRFAYDLGRFGARQLQYDRAPQMAAALAFRALFGLVPVLVVATVLVRAVIGVDEFLTVIRQTLAWTGLDQVRILHPGGGEVASQTLADWVGNLISEAAGIRLTAIGWVGLAVVCYAAVSLLFTIENAFNIIYRASDGRPWTRRLPLYWFVLTVSPLVIGVGSWLNARVEDLLTAIDAWPWALMTARVLWIGWCGWLIMLTVYMLLPNARVHFKPAALGALVAVVILELGKRALGATLQNAFSISHLYGSLGLIPLFMFWTYLMWLAVLFGLQVSAILQMLHGRRLDEMERRRQLTGLIEPASVIVVMEVIARRFDSGAATTADQIADEVNMPRATVQVILEHLVDRGLVHRLDRDTAAVALALPAEQITADQLIDVGFAMIDESKLSQRSTFLDRLRNVQREVAGQQSLAGLLSSAAGQ
jgi:membrane protein